MRCIDATGQPKLLELLEGLVQETHRLICLLLQEEPLVKELLGEDDSKEVRKL